MSNEEQADSTPIIEARENGPLIAKNVKTFRLPDGALEEDKPIRALCRCGMSQNKPYCDGSHNDAGFDSSPGDPENHDKVSIYEGSDITVYYNRLLCSHAAECGRLASDVFNTKERPWIQPDKGSAEQISQVVASCPSGALRMGDPGGEPLAITNDEVSVQVEKDGPYWVRNIALSAEYWAEGQSQKKYVLCRCGLSKNKPCCDGTHADEGWSDD